MSEKITKAQMAKIINMLLLVCELSNHKRDLADNVEVLIAYWHKKFKNESYETFANAVDAYTDNNRFFPAVCDIKDIITDLKCPEFQETAEEAWESIQRVVRSCGRDKEGIALSQVSELAAKACRAIGYRSICDCDINRLGVPRGQFKKAFESIATRERDECKEIGDNKFVLEQIHKNEKLLAESTNLIGTEKPVKKIEDEFRESDTDAYKLAKCREIRAMIMKGEDDDED